LTKGLAACAVRADTLLGRVAATGAYADCYVADIEARVSHAEFVEAFYTTPLFKLERWLFRHVAARGSTDDEARQLARGERDTFAAWSVEGRERDQLLLADFTGRTKSWLMVESSPDDRPVRSRLYFGSAVMPARGRRGSQRGMGVVFTALLGMHKLYSRALLRAARARLLRR